MNLHYRCGFPTDAVSFGQVKAANVASLEGAFWSDRESFQSGAQNCKTRPSCSLDEIQGCLILQSVQNQANYCSMVGAGPKMCIVVYGGTGYIGRAAVRVAQMGLLNGIRAWMLQQIGCL